LIDPDEEDAGIRSVGFRTQDLVENRLRFGDPAGFFVQEGQITPSVGGGGRRSLQAVEFRFQSPEGPNLTAQTSSFPPPGACRLNC
jgi:hypothetical protein